MAREIIDETNLEQVVGGSIVFNADHTTCGLNCNNQLKVLNFDAVLQYISENKQDMTEREMLKNMVAMGYLVKL